MREFSEQELVRREKLNKLKELGLDPFGQKFNRDSLAMDIKNKYQNVDHDDFENMTDKDHLQNITKNPVNFLKQSGKGFFVDKEGYLIALKDEMQAVLQEGGMKFADEVKDIVQYRVLEYYWKRYRGKA